MSSTLYTIEAIDPESAWRNDTDLIDCVVELLHSIGNGHTMLMLVPQPGYEELCRYEFTMICTLKPLF